MKSGDIFYPVVWWEGISEGIGLGGLEALSGRKVLGGAACWKVWGAVGEGGIGTVERWMIGLGAGGGRAFVSFMPRVFVGWCTGAMKMGWAAPFVVVKGSELGNGRSGIDE